MELKKYQSTLTDPKTQKTPTNKVFAKMIKVSASHLTHYYKGRKSFSPDKAFKIEKATMGAVTVRELLSNAIKKKKAAAKRKANDQIEMGRG